MKPVGLKNDASIAIAHLSAYRIGTSLTWSRPAGNLIDCNAWASLNDSRTHFCSAQSRHDTSLHEHAECRIPGNQRRRSLTSNSGSPDIGDGPTPIQSA